MKTYDEQEELRDSDTEITLGIKSVLGIFFGLALVCGVFFGFGYSLGHSSSNTVKPIVPAATTPQPVSAPPSPVKTVVEGGASSDGPAPLPGKPSAASATVVSQPLTPTTGALVPAVQTQAVPTPAAAAIMTTTAPAANAASPATATAPAGIAPANIMVQIAAVSRPDDANALVAALRKLGYSASACTEPGDSLLHVQIGPFATRDQAKAMRSRLMSDGYNAILK